MLLALLVAASSGPDVHLSVAAGVGTAYGYAGVHGEVSLGNVAVFGGLGLGMLMLPESVTDIATGGLGATYGGTPPHLPFALGLRWSMEPEGGLFLAATGCT